jgi:hypothetical protein
MKLTPAIYQALPKEVKEQLARLADEHNAKVQEYNKLLAEVEAAIAWIPSPPSPAPPG